ncbi:hypothetical protein N7466_001856 [Penicillium verhagenii]|uniref:uncharacterized protein n=1 Tax=Penicillium verhagenii TaxID=1562060 RepID=UPI00254563DF|nr:uncharacterized protein N7466_001856 [Penicillium verhagenii]KAJ5938722.1 hypothetical protein N7466_001856 [Penicillium verhagenii]
MGRQAYLNRLALGRSPYEPQETATVDPSNPVRRVSNIHADDYMQQYDARGHQVNPESKSLGRALRRAKNDILSTMGIVVSSEDRNANTSNDKQKMNQIMTENDFGLVITTLDQVFVFISTWWSSSLTGRILTFKHYTHAPLLDVIRSERVNTGIVGFYFAGIPAWAVSSTLAIARESPLRRLSVTIRDYVLSLISSNGLALSTRALFGVGYSMVKHSVLILSLEAYMYSVLQGLSLVPANSIPSLRQLIPFGKTSLFQLPTLPADFSIPSIGGFVMQLLTSPGVLTFVYAFYLRPELEERIYRLIRRQIPKPSLADELSIRVAYEENLIEWVVPTLGRRSEEESRRAKLTLTQDIKQELVALRGWVFSLFGLFSSKAPEQPRVDGQGPENIENHLRQSIESLQHELEEIQLRTNVAGVEQRDILARPLEAIARDDDDNESINSVPDLEPVQAPDSELGPDMNQVLTNENRMSQSPGEMSNDFFSEIATVGRASAPSSASRSQSRSSNIQQAERSARPRQNSRSNTLFSRPSSPETSPPTSPRVRASLIHQSSDIITMQLELLGNRNRQNDTPAQRNPPFFGRTNPATAMDRRSIVDFLEALILSQAQQQAAEQSPIPENEDLSSIAAGANYGTGQEIPAVESQPHNIVQEAMADHHIDPAPSEEPLVSNMPSILPVSVEEPNDGEHISFRPLDLAEEDGLPLGTALPPMSQIPGMMAMSQPPIAHRVTLLSAHPVDSLASHLAAILSTIILSPLESLYVRSLAHSYLSLNPSSTLRVSDLHPVGLWGGGRTWSDTIGYCGRLVLMRAMQSALRAAVWGFLVGSTMRIGRKFCGWGTL